MCPAFWGGGWCRERGGTHRGPLTAVLSAPPPVRAGRHGMVNLEGALHVRLIGKPHRVRRIRQGHALRQKPPCAIDAQVLQIATGRHPKSRMR